MAPLGYLIKTPFDSKYLIITQDILTIEFVAMATSHRNKVLRVILITKLESEYPVPNQQQKIQNLKLDCCHSNKYSPDSMHDVKVCVSTGKGNL